VRRCVRCRLACAVGRWRWRCQTIGLLNWKSPNRSKLRSHCWPREGMPMRTALELDQRRIARRCIRYLLWILLKCLELARVAHLRMTVFRIGRGSGWIRPSARSCRGGWTRSFFRRIGGHGGRTASGELLGPDQRKLRRAFYRGGSGGAVPFAMPGLGGCAIYDVRGRGNRSSGRFRLPV